MKKLKLLLQLPAWGKLIFLETFCYSLYTAFLLGNQKDQRKITAILSRSLPAGTRNSTAGEKQELKTIRMVSSAIQTIAKHTPWRNVCYHQAMQAKLLLSRRGIPSRVLIGFKKNDGGGIEGHAWTKHRKQIITGFCREEEYIILTEF